MLAMIRTFPPQRSHCSISMRNTRFSRLAQLMAQCRSAGLRSLAADLDHGAFASRFGCIALGRTDSELFNYFHYNPWTVTDGHNHPEGPPDFELDPQGLPESR